MIPYPLLWEGAVRTVGSHGAAYPTVRRCPTPPRGLRPTVSWGGEVGVQNRGVAPPPPPGCAQLYCGVGWWGVGWGAEGAVTKRQWLGCSCTQENARREGCVSKRALCVLCCARAAEGRPPLRRRAVAVQGCPGDIPPLCLMVPLGFPPPTCLRALVRRF